MQKVVKTKSKKVKSTPDNIHLHSYIHRVLKQIHPDTSIKGSTVEYLDDMLEFVLKEMMKTINIIKRHSTTDTVDSRDVQTAVRILIPGELAKHAVSQATKAITLYNQAVKAKQRMTIHQRAGLILPVTRVENSMRKLASGKRMSKGAPIYMTAVLEYLLAELLELAGNATRDFKKKQISVKHLGLAILNDEELNNLFKKANLTCIIVPNIHSALLPKAKAKKAKKTKKA